MGPRGGAPLTPRAPRRLDGAEVRRRLQAAGSDVPAPGGAAAFTAGLRELPDWVSEAGLAPDVGGFWLWVETREDSSEAGPRQLLLDVPAGRYELSFYDPAAREWFGLESAAAAPLLVGVPARSPRLAVRVRPSGSVRGERPAGGGGS